MFLPCVEPRTGALRVRRLTVAALLCLAALLMQRGEAAGALPALYTAAQAKAGQAVFEQKCATCHGRHLEGLAGPALKGPLFASVKAGYKVRDIFLFLSVNMPAYAPGSLSMSQYVQIMSFILQQNGYPAGTAALTQRLASTSTVPLLYHAGGGTHDRLVKGCTTVRQGAKGHLPRCKPLAATLAAGAGGAAGAQHPPGARRAVR